MFIVRCNATAIFYYNLVFDGKANPLFIAIFWYFVIIILYCKMIHPVIFFSTTYIFYSIYFIIQYNIEPIFANTSIIEYWFFFRMLNIFSRNCTPC